VVSDPQIREVIKREKREYAKLRKPRYRHIAVTFTRLFVFVLEVSISTGKNVLLRTDVFSLYSFSCPVWFVRKTCTRRRDWVFCFQFGQRDYGSAAFKHSVFLSPNPRAR